LKAGRAVPVNITTPFEIKNYDPKNLTRPQSTRSTRLCMRLNKNDFFCCRLRKLDGFVRQFCDRGSLRNYGSSCARGLLHSCSRCSADPLQACQLRSASFNRILLLFYLLTLDGGCSFLHSAGEHLGHPSSGFQPWQDSRYFFFSCSKNKIN